MIVTECTVHTHIDSNTNTSRPDLHYMWTWNGKTAEAFTRRVASCGDKPSRALTLSLNLPLRWSATYVDGICRMPLGYAVAVLPWLTQHSSGPRASRTVARCA